MRFAHVAPTKRCQECAEYVRCEAKVCKYCGHEFGPKQRWVARRHFASSSRTWIPIVGVALIMLVAGATLWYLDAAQQRKRQDLSDAIERAHQAQREADRQAVLGIDIQAERRRIFQKVIDANAKADSR